MTIEPRTAAWLSRRFGIPVETIRWYNGGVCYDRVVVTTKEAADRVTAHCQGRTVNGGMLHGMPLGGQTEIKDAEGNTAYDVTC